MKFTSPKIVMHCMVLMSICWASAVQAQDLHFSQFYHSPLNLSPGLAGIYSGDIRFIGNYNSQWENVPVDYLTFSGAIEKKFYYEGLKSSYFAVGLLFNYDQAGTSELSRTNIGVTGSYSRQLAPTFFATLGASVGITQRAFNLANLTFDEQFDGEQFDPSIPVESFDKTNSLNPDFAAGLNFRLQPADAHRLTKRSKLDFGLGVHHLTQPNEAFNLNEDIRLNMRFSGYALATLMLTNSFDILLRGTAQFQGPYRENLGSMSAKIHLNRQPSREVAIVLGGSYRFDSNGDAIIPHIEFHVQRWLLGLNYDVNISAFQTATLRRGGPEVAFRYIFTSVKPLEVQKICPII